LNRYLGTGHLAAFFGKLLFSIWLERPAGRITLLLGVTTLILLTLTAAIPINVIGPFDARTCELATGVYVEYLSVGAAMEPVTALAHIIAGAPDARVTAVSIPIWITGLVICVAAVGRLRRNRWRPDWRIVTGTLKAVSIWVFVLAVYGMFIILVRIPNWRAVAQDPDILLVELQTHTFGSHDGLISARDCLRFHRRRGCDVVAVVEHRTPEGSLEAAALADSDESLPSVLPGVEIKLEHIGYIVAIGPSELIARYSFTDRKGSFISSFKQNCQGVVLALTHRLTLERIKHLIDLGLTVLRWPVMPIPDSRP